MEMKSTGVVRKIDQLGRVVIPKELRRIMNINEGQPIEIFTSNNMIIFKKYETSIMHQEREEAIKGLMKLQKKTLNINDIKSIDKAIEILDRGRY